MTIPSASSFPDAMDTDDNLFLVHDSLRVRLSEDYNKGDTTIYVQDDSGMMANFPATGIITLTEQCSDIDKRALSFYYSSKTSSTFENLEILPEFSSLDCTKPKKSTNVTMNVVDLHHNHLKDALIAAERFVGTKYDPEADTIAGRIDNLKSIVLSPRAWFSCDVAYGLAPLTVKFSNESLRMGKGYAKQKWTFTDINSNEEVHEVETDTVEDYASNKIETKKFSEPGRYSVSLRVENDYGYDEVSFTDMIVVKTECPDEAKIQINHKASQNYSEVNGKPRVRSSTNMFVDLEVPEGNNPDNPGHTFAGESLKSPPPHEKIDPIHEYSWNLGDDLPHPNSRLARASYERGGYYDITLRVDTSFGSYRITNYEKSIDIIEQTNLWLYKYEDYQNSGGTIQAYEFGLIGETFKTLGNPVTIDRNDSFLGSSKDYKKEFDNNVEFAKSGSLGSGDKEGHSMIFWAKGGISSDSKKIGIKKHNGFSDVYEDMPELSDRPWNWAAMSSTEKTYFIFGQASETNRVLAERVEYDLSTRSAGVVSLSSSDFENGADELLLKPGSPSSGYFVSYRSAWKDQTGYILRNSAVNEFFRFGDFYKTKGSLSSPFGTITKMPDMPGSVKIEGQLVSLFNGVFFFNNSGEICAWNDTSLTWEVGRASSTSLSFRSVQDTSKQNFDDRSNTLRAASDGDRVAYLSYDYSSKAFIKFNGTDLTFSLLKQRPEGPQFKMGVY